MACTMNSYRQGIAMRPINPAPINPRRRALLGAALFAWLCPAWSALNQKWLKRPDIPDLRLIDQDGQFWRLFEDLIQGRVVVVNFIFAGCVTVCPPQTALLRALRKQLDQQPREVLLLSLTVDPLNDRPPQLREFARRYDIQLGIAHGWLMLTGSMRDMEQVLAAFDASAPAPDAHTALLWLGNEPRQRWTRVSSLNPPHTLLRLIGEVQA